jgi:metal-responsive CopG/Arc/MetJ family transcriptional regulator
MGRVNIELPDELHKKMKIVCATDSATISEFIQNAIEQKLKKRG